MCQNLLYVAKSVLRRKFITLTHRVEKSLKWTVYSELNKLNSDKQREENNEI